MKVKIWEIIDYGHDDERIVLKVLEDSDIGDYLVLDTTYTLKGAVSNKVRHPYWFPDQKVKKGDTVELYTKKGNSKERQNSNGTTTYIYHWNLGNNVWNNDGDCALLLHIDQWTHHTVTLKR